MKTLFTNGYSNLAVDTSTNKIENVDTFNKYEIAEMLILPEDMHIVYRHGVDQYEADGKKGNIVLLFGDKDRYSNPIVVLKDKKLTQNALGYVNFVEKTKEEWASAKANIGCGCPCCDECNVPATAEKPSAKKQVRRSNKQKKA